MQRFVLNQQLYRANIINASRRVFALLQFKNFKSKTGLSIFGGTLLLGTGMVLATAQTTPSNIQVQSAPVLPAASTNNETTSISNVPVTSPVVPETNNGQPSANSASGSASNTSSVHTNITVNGQAIPVPANGTLQQTITNDNGSTRVEVSTQNSSENGSTYSSVQTNTFSSGSNQSVTTTQNGVSN